jgi:hypothetical protein
MHTTRWCGNLLENYLEEQEINGRITLRWMTLRAMPAGASAPGRVTQAGQVEGDEQTKNDTLVLQVWGWAWG